MLLHIVHYGAYGTYGACGEYGALWCIMVHYGAYCALWCIVGHCGALWYVMVYHTYKAQGSRPLKHHWPIVGLIFL